MQKSGNRKPIAEINVVPYIDVMLVLLVIFMVTTPLLSQGVQVNLPKAVAKPLIAKQQEPIVVSVNAKGQYFLNIAAHPENPVSDDAIVNQVSAALTLDKQQNQKRQVLVKGDTAVNYGKVVEAMVLLQQAGAKSVGLITEPQDSLVAPG